MKCASGDNQRWRQYSISRRFCDFNKVNDIFSVTSSQHFKIENHKFAVSTVVQIGARWKMEVHMFPLGALFIVKGRKLI